MIHCIRKHTKNDRAEANYISTVVYILVVVITLAVIMDVLAVIMTKQKLDAAADQVTRHVLIQPFPYEYATVVVLPVIQPTMTPP